MWAEFKKFALKGNVLDLAVAVVIGAAFGKIVSSLVDSIIMPLVGIILGGYDFKGLSVKIGDATVAYGVFIQNVVDFFIVAFAIFLFVKGIERFKKKKEEEPASAPEPDRKEELLQEILITLQQSKQKDSL
ncbi:large conductance mechanosensitive channel protein MscL [Priestia endophytica]|uniref:Large-conductance mechanosensitive channel n=1 Tax=Priestia endophytica TaxID=135735 RepID=A0AAX1QBU6_9BACI|nr:large conductance mechanosensitive channel protein MscL [Priestia endophytica]RAS77934.1 large-conductance mechanosensitive channel [Priestia endophytica]RAS93097.1 large-conductance mechanosensitive channel [Priestia endophytica]